MVKIIAGSHDFGLIAANYNPPAPAAGYGKLYQRVDGNFYKMNVTGPELPMMDGGRWAKPNCKAATTANITLSGAQTIDGVSCVAGDRVLVKNQGTNSQNGIYVVQTGTWTRAPDASTAPFLAGAMTMVDQGTNAGRQFRTYFKATDTVGTTGIDWWYVVDTLSGSILYASATPGAGLAVTGNTLSIGVGGVDSNMIANNSITDTDVATANKDGATGTASMRTLGTGAQQAAAGNDQRLSPTGAIIMFGGSTAPSGWFLCTGGTISRTTWAALFAVIGTTYGAGDGSTTFTLPNMTSAFPQGVGGADALGATGGKAAADIVNHTHNTATHAHNTGGQYASTTTTGGTANRITDLANQIGGTGTGFTAPTSGSGALTTGNPNQTSVTTGENRPPYVTMNFIIKA